MNTREEKRETKVPHNLVMEDRQTLSVTGVLDVDSFDEENIIVDTSQGELTINGTELHITRLSVETGELNVTGQILGLNYNDTHPKQGGFFGKLFR